MRVSLPLRRVLMRGVLLSLVVAIGVSLTGCVSAVTIGQNVAVINPPDEFHARERMYLHEEIHKAQYRQRGTLRMLFAYLLSPSLRQELEAEAYAAELCYMVQVGATNPKLWEEGFARAIRTYALVPGVSTDDARTRLGRAYLDGASCVRLLRQAGQGWLLANNP